jgi:hypothetical protein
MIVGFIDMLDVVGQSEAIADPRLSRSPQAQEKDASVCSGGFG